MAERCGHLGEADSNVEHHDDCEPLARIAARCDQTSDPGREWQYASDQHGDRHGGTQPESEHEPDDAAEDAGV